MFWLGYFSVGEATYLDWDTENRFKRRRLNRNVSELSKKSISCHTREGGYLVTYCKTDSRLRGNDKKILFGQPRQKEADLSLAL